jgi:hypothetical protein
MPEPTTDLEVQPDSMESRRGFDDMPSGGGMDASELVESLLSNSHIPSDVVDEFWVLFGKSTKLSFLKDNDITMLMLQFELLRLTIIENIPKSEYNEKLEMKLIQIRIEFELNLNRSRGARMNERELLGSSTTASFTERPMGHSSEEPGFLDKIARMFR